MNWRETMDFSEGHLMHRLNADNARDLSSDKYREHMVVNDVVNQIVEHSQGHVVGGDSMEVDAPRQDHVTSGFKDHDVSPSERLSCLYQRLAMLSNLENHASLQDMGKWASDSAVNICRHLSSSIRHHRDFEPGSIDQDLATEDTRLRQVSLQHPIIKHLEEVCRIEHGLCEGSGVSVADEHENAQVMEKLTSLRLRSEDGMTRLADLEEAVAEMLERTIARLIECRNAMKEMRDYQSLGSKDYLEQQGAGDKKPGMNSKPSDQSPVEQVALLVPTTDDASLPVWTFRTWTLGILSCVLMAFLNTFFSYRAEPVVITIATALIGTSPLGHFMAAVLPDKTVHILGTPAKWRFSLNPGPFNAKEHTLITIFASAGSFRSGGIFVINAVTIFFRRRMAAAAGLLFVLTAELLAYSLAGIMQKFLVEPAEMWWPSSLVSVSIVRALHSKEKHKGMPQIRFFYVALAASFAYYVLPGYLFPSMTSLSILCFAFPKSTLAQQLGSGKAGLGLGAFSFDWASIAAFLGSPLVAPWFAVANILVGFLLQAYLVVPFTYWHNIFHAKTFPLFSTSIFNSSGREYDVNRIISDNELEVDPSKLAAQGVVFTSTFFAISCGFTFATFGASVSHVLLFHGREVVNRCRAALGVCEQKVGDDVHTRLIKAYKSVPLPWYLIVFVMSSGLAILALEIYPDQLQMRWWGLVLGLALAAILLLPIGILVATTNQQPNLAIMSQYLMGYVSPGRPIANVVFRTYSTVLCGRTVIYLSNFKLGHYMKVPPRATFIVQLIGTIVATTTSIMVSWWLKATVDHICDLDKLPSSTPWTCPHDRVFYDQTVIWGLVGPQKMFGPYINLNWFFLMGLAAPFVVWLLRRMFPNKAWLRYINTPLILQGAAPMPPAAAVNNTSWLTMAGFFSFFVYMRRRRWWQRYNHILSAALDAGTALMGVLINYALDGIHLDWWGGGANKCPLASCPTAPGIAVPGCPVL